ncbi:hypothetical protein B9Z19DRAFT_1060273 [Tuber borchii]|uniref:Uncharacterized protein n=1 Tax=Tuber borchii TaxID=42251 RepID=A0A2T7A9J3_TUBBO|nr:hypothetical protein B9Z19DRAFT_1060273 [Tuber borchii]
MSISRDRISNKAEVTFSRQDSRYNPTPEEQSISQMREDLGDHRIVNLPLSGARVLGAAPAPNPEKGGTQNTKMALEGDHLEAWGALFDPSLVIDRSDGLGQGQSYRIGPNYQPISAPRFPFKRPGYLFRSGSEPGLHPIPRSLLGVPGPRITSDSLNPRTSLQIRNDPNKAAPPATPQNQPGAFRTRPARSGIPLGRVIWHTGNLITANQDFYDYIKSKTATNQSVDPPTPNVGTTENRIIQPAPKPITTTNVSPKTESHQSIDIASHKPELQKFVDAAPTTVSGTSDAEARQDLASQSVAVVGAEMPNQKTSEISQEAFQFALKTTSKKLRAVSEAGVFESRPSIDLPAMFGWLENEMQLTARALLGCSPNSHDYDIKAIFNKTRLKALADKINEADNHLSEEMKKMYQFKASLQDIKSRSKKMEDDFLRIKTEHDEFVVKQKRIAEIEADKKAADELAQRNWLEEQRQMALEKEKLLQEKQRIEEKQQLEKRRQEEKHQEEHRQEELKEKARLEAELLKEQRLERARLEKQRPEKRQQEGPLQGDEHPQKEKQRGLDRLRYEKQQLIEKHRLDKLLNDERIKAEQMEVRRLAAQRMEDQLSKERQEKKHAQNEPENVLARERLGGSQAMGIDNLNEYPDPYGRGRIEAENAHERFREITQVRSGHFKESPSTRTPLKEVSHHLGTQLAAEGERETAVPKESSDLDNGKINSPLFPYKLHLQLTPLFEIPPITAWVGRLTDPTVEIEKAIRQHLSDDELKVLKKVEAYKQFLARATDHHTRKLAKDSGRQ